MQNNFVDRLRSVDNEGLIEAVRDAFRLHTLCRQRMVEEFRVVIERGWNSPVSSKSVKDILDEMKKQEF